MIEVEETTFPQNVVVLIAECAEVIDSEPDPANRIAIFKRPLKDTDPNQSVGVFGSQWNPQADSYEMRGGPAGPSQPTLQVYTIGVQAFVKDMDEQRGLATHSVMAKLLRTMLYRDPTLRVGLSGLVSTAGGSTERAKRWGVRNQALISNELTGSWLYLSTLNFWIETETI